MDAVGCQGSRPDSGRCPHRAAGGPTPAGRSSTEAARKRPFIACVKIHSVQPGPHLYRLLRAENFQSDHWILRMPTIEVRLNDRPLAVGAGRDFEVLTLGVLGGLASEPATAQLTGWRKSTGEHFQWFRTPLSRQDRIQVALRKEGTPTPAIISGQVGADFAPISSESESMGRSLRNGRSKIAFLMTLGTQIIRASAHGSVLLQATATWHRSDESLKMEMGCAGNGESNEGNFWIETRAEYDEVVEIEIL